LGAVVGTGDQWVSWIHRSDIIQVIKNALNDKAYTGAINVVAPEAVRQKDFQKSFSNLLKRPQFIKVPGFALKSVLGEFSQLALDSQRVEATKLKALGYRYLYPDLEAALKESLNIVLKNGSVHACHRLEAAQFIDRPRDEVFAFFCDPHNLEKITPPLLSFKIAAISSKDIAEGTIIDYKLKVHSVPMKWKTLIKDWVPNEVFVDNQEKGPYSIWHHTHRFYEVKGGTLMTDRVLYRLPMGLLGDSVALPLVKKDVTQIFGFRKEVIREQFPSQAKNKSSV
jgi:ligand-binding SRPBCC domain-containing protein